MLEQILKRYFNLEDKDSIIDELDMIDNISWQHRLFYNIIFERSDWKWLFYQNKQEKIKLLIM
jgi:hypothetical protein